MNTSGFIDAVLKQREHIKLYEDTVLVSVGDGNINLQEVEALLGCLNMMQADTGKLICRLNQANLLMPGHKQGPGVSLDAIPEGVSCAESSPI